MVIRKTHFRESRTFNKTINSSISLTKLQDHHRHYLLRNGQQSLVPKTSPLKKRIYYKFRLKRAIIVRK
jgi:hypothetical protein